MKKYIIAIALLVISNNSYAWVNLALGAAEVAAPFVIREGVSFLLPTAPSTNIPTPVTATSTTVTKNAIGSYAGKSMTVALAIGTGALMEYAISHQALNPYLATLAQTQTNAPLGVTGASSNLPSGSYLNVDNANYGNSSAVVRTSGAGVIWNSNYLAATTPRSLIYNGDIFVWVPNGGAANANGLYGYTQWCYPGSITSAPVPVYAPSTAEIFSLGLNASPLAQAEISNALVANPSLATYPSADVIANAQAATAAATATASTAAQTAAQTAVTNAQTAYNAAPSATTQAQLDLARLELAKLELAQAQKAQDALEQETLEEPNLPDNNEYNTDVVLPDKKPISSLLSSFVNSSPLVCMVKTFTMSASGTGVVPVGNVYGTEMKFDFSRYEGTFRSMGGILLIIMHGFAILVVVRGW